MMLMQILGWGWCVGCVIIQWFLEDFNEFSNDVHHHIQDDEKEGGDVIIIGIVIVMIMTQMTDWSLEFHASIHAENWENK